MNKLRYRKIYEELSTLYQADATGFHNLDWKDCFSDQIKVLEKSYKYSTYTSTLILSEIYVRACIMSGIIYNSFEQFILQMEKLEKDYNNNNYNRINLKHFYNLNYNSWQFWETFIQLLVSSGYTLENVLQYVENGDYIKKPSLYEEYLLYYDVPYKLVFDSDSDVNIKIPDEIFCLVKIHCPTEEKWRPLIHIKNWGFTALPIDCAYLAKQTMVI